MKHKSRPPSFKEILTEAKEEIDGRTGRQVARAPVSHPPDDQFVDESGKVWRCRDAGYSRRVRRLILKDSVSVRTWSIAGEQSLVVAAQDRAELVALLDREDAAYQYIWDGRVVAACAACDVLIQEPFEYTDGHGGNLIIVGEQQVDVWSLDEL